MKFTYSISDNDLFSMYKDSWEMENQHDFPELTQKETKRLKAELSSLVKNHIADLIDQSVNDRDTFTRLVSYVYYNYDTLLKLDLKILEERAAKSQAAEPDIQKAIRLLSEWGYEVRKP
jgi:hypothetical protein